MRRIRDVAWTCTLGGPHRAKWRLFWLVVASMPWLLVKSGRLGDELQAWVLNFTFIIAFLAVFGLIDAARRVVTLEEELRRLLDGTTPAAPRGPPVVG